MNPSKLCTYLVLKEWKCENAVVLRFNDDILKLKVNKEVSSRGRTYMMYLNIEVYIEAVILKKIGSLVWGPQKSFFISSIIQQPNQNRNFGQVGQISSDCKAEKFAMTSTILLDQYLENLVIRVTGSKVGTTWLGRVLQIMLRPKNYF